MEPNFDLLHTLQPVEPPPFLFTRIEQQLVQRKQNRFQPRLAWLAVSTAVLVLVFNITLATRQPTTAKTDLPDTFLLLPQNTLYNE
jgi:hypothetical protein